MTRTLVIPAAGRGTRLGYDGPKALFKINGRPMLHRVIDQYRLIIDHVVIVAAPDQVGAIEASFGRVHAVVGSWPFIQVVEQEEPTGMFPAILKAIPRVMYAQPAQVWVTWCDMIHIQKRTIGQVAEVLAQVTAPAPALAFPTVCYRKPYVHFVRDDRDRIVDVKQRREGSTMPEVGEGDIGLFGFTLTAFVNLPSLLVPDMLRGAVSQELNFLPAIPMLQRSGYVVSTFPAASCIEARGVNTPEEARQSEIDTL